MITMIMLNTTTRTNNERTINERTNGLNCAAVFAEVEKRRENNLITIPTMT